MSHSISTYRKLLYSLLFIIILSVVLELGLRAVYFQEKSDIPLALLKAFTALNNRMELYRQSHLRKDAAGDVKLNEFAENMVWTEEGKELTEYLLTEYEKHFSRLAEQAKEADTRLIVLLINTKGNHEEKVSAFFTSLTKKYNIEFVETKKAFSGHDYDSITLLPFNGHLSRFGNILVSKVLAEVLQKHSAFRSSWKAEKRVRVMGDLTPDRSDLVTSNFAVPYRVIVNENGFRKTGNISFPKTKQRILCLGDSFTFGPYLPQHDTYPAILQRMMPECEIINAGVCGYTITDQASLFAERAKYCEADITGLLYFMKNRFDRKGKAYFPSETEKKFLKIAGEKMKAN